MIERACLLTPVTAEKTFSHFQPQTRMDISFILNSQIGETLRRVQMVRLFKSACGAGFYARGASGALIGHRLNDQGLQEYGR
jgi:hypothetical protein